MIHPNVIAEIPGVELESNNGNTVEPVLLYDIYLVKDSIEQAATAKNCFDMGKQKIMSHSQIKGVDDVIEIDSDSDLEEDDINDSTYMPNLLKQEYVDRSEDKLDNTSVRDNPEDQNDVVRL